MAENMKISMRIAQSEDLDTVIDFVKAMAIDSEGVTLDHETVTAGVKGIVHNPQRGRYIIADCDGKPAGCMLNEYEWSDWRAKNVIWIHSVYVHPDFRRRGVFSAMYEYVKSQVQSDDSLAGLRLYVDKTNPRAIECYKAVGMTDEHYHLYEWLK